MIKQDPVPRHLISACHTLIQDSTRKEISVLSYNKKISASGAMTYTKGNI